MTDFSIGVSILNNILISDIFGYLYRICRSLLITGKNPSGTAGYAAINLGINNLSATVKTDIANRSVDCFMMSVQLCFQNEL